VREPEPIFVSMDNVEMSGTGYGNILFKFNCPKCGEKVFLWEEKPGGVTCTCGILWKQKITISGEVVI